MSTEPDRRPLALVGLGKMGANMARRFARGGITVHGFDTGAEARVALADERGIETHSSLADVLAAIAAPRTIWLMLPAGEVSEQTLAEMLPLLAPGDLVIDGANANYLDTQRHAREAAVRGIDFVDCGVSGGVWGLQNGYCLMLGGEAQAVARAQPYVQVLAPAPERGWLHCGPAGAGHFVKMIHNGIEYGMMQALAEGFALLAGRPEFNIDLAGVAETWREGSVVRSWLLDLTAQALQGPDSLDSVTPWVADSGEGRWSVDEAIRQGTPAPVIVAALMSRFDSQGKADTANRLLALMRKGFGGHTLR